MKKHLWFLGFLTVQAIADPLTIAVGVKSNDAESVAIGDGQYRITYSAPFTEGIDLRITPTPESKVEIWCGGNLQTFPPTLDLDISVDDDVIWKPFIEAVRLHPKGSIFIIHKGSQVSRLGPSYILPEDQRSNLENYICNRKIHFIVDEKLWNEIKTPPNQALLTLGRYE